MNDALIAWDAEDDPDGNVRHIAEHNISQHEVEQVMRNRMNPVTESRSSGLPMTTGRTWAGRRIAVVWEYVSDNPLVVRPVTAYDPD